MTKKVKFLFNSFQRYSGSNDTPTFVLPNSQNAKRCYIQKVMLPHTFYNITTDNNVIYFTDSLAADVSATITPGNYTITEFLTAVSTGMTAAATDSLTYTASKNTKTRKVTITNSGAAVFSIRYVANQHCPSCIFTLLGFYELYNDLQFFGDLNRIASLTGLSSYTSNYSYYMSPQNIIVKSNLVRKSNNYKSNAFFNENNQIIKNGVSDILSVIPVTSNYGDLIVYEPFYPDLIEMNDLVISEVSFSLVKDQFYEPLQLNGRSWSIEIVFEY